MESSRYTRSEVIVNVLEKSIFAEFHFYFYLINILSYWCTYTYDLRDDRDHSLKDTMKENLVASFP